MDEVLKDIRGQIPSLIDLSFKGLANLFDSDQQLFAYYIKDGKKIPMPLGWSICYTTMTVLGIHKARRKGWQGIDFYKQEDVLASLLGKWERADKFGHLGLLHWVNAECGGAYAENITDAIKGRTVDEYLNSLPTTELAWLLIGLCATAKTRPSDGNLKDLAILYFKTLSANFNTATHLFRHTRQKANSFDLRSQIGNFADQIYSIFALSAYYDVFKDDQALERAAQCADRVCALQGNQGQWYWHYHAPRGLVVSRYPVFAVHQDGMGPMGLLKLSEVSGKDYQTPVLKGLGWLFGANELGIQMIDREKQLIWRDIERKSPAANTRYISMLLAEMNCTGPIQPLNSEYSLRLNREMRPYELGWLLYGLSDFKKA